MIVYLHTSWDVDPETWGEAAGMDERLCHRDLMHYLSACISDLPIYDENEDVVPRQGPPYGGILADQLDGRVRFEIGWLLEAPAESWRRYRRERESFTGAPVRRLAHRDMAEFTARELYGLPLVTETDAVMRVLHPYTATYTPQGRRRAGDSTPNHSAH